MYLDEAINIFEEFVEDYKISLIPGAGPTDEEEQLLYAMEMALDCMKKEHCGEAVEEENERGYTPTCPQGYTDCVCDPAYIKWIHPEWYKKLYGDMSPEEASKERCDPEEEYCYDDEDK